MRQAYNRLAHTLRNNVPIIKHLLKTCESCKNDVRGKIEKRLDEIMEAFDGRTGYNDTVHDDDTGPGDAPEV